jgi:hypothetical protein
MFYGGQIDRAAGDVVESPSRGHPMGWIPMSAYVDFATLKAEVNIADVAQWLRLEVKPSGNKLR